MQTINELQHSHITSQRFRQFFPSLFKNLFPESLSYNIVVNKRIKKFNQSCPKTRTHFGFRITLMKGFDPLEMLTSVVFNNVITNTMRP